MTDQRQLHRCYIAHCFAGTVRAPLSYLDSRYEPRRHEGHKRGLSLCALRAFVVPHFPVSAFLLERRPFGIPFAQQAPTRLLAPAEANTQRLMNHHALNTL